MKRTIPARDMVQCDRCKVEFEEKPSTILYRATTFRDGAPSTYDLCHACYQAVLSLIKTNPNSKTVES